MLDLKLNEKYGLYKKFTCEIGGFTRITNTMIDIIGGLSK